MSENVVKNIFPKMQWIQTEVLILHRTLSNFPTYNDWIIDFPSKEADGTLLLL